MLTVHYQFLSRAPAHRDYSITVSTHFFVLVHDNFHSAYSLKLANLFAPDNTGFTVNAFAVNYENAWKPFSVSDTALLHATLCLVAQHEDLLRGVEDSSTSLYHKGQVMKVINQRLIDDPKNMSDASVTSIALLVILEVRSFQTTLTKA